MNIKTVTCGKLDNTNTGKYYVSNGPVRKYIFGTHMPDGQKILGSVELIPANINNLEETDILKSLSLIIDDEIIDWEGTEEKATSDGWLISVMVETSNLHHPEAIKYLIYLDNRPDGNISFSICGSYSTFEPKQRVFDDSDYLSKELGL